MTGYLAVALGGACGAMCRHAVGGVTLRLMGPGFPWGTLTVNVVGSFIMGVAIALFARYVHATNELRLLVATGFLGGFTTFSAFSLDTVLLFERGAVTTAVAYTVFSVALSIGALFAGLTLIRAMG
ncbi:MAG: fluoride efflux transporter CrcB [Rhodobiaceae bacterium]|nr:fluoride efflux transporter CrcB [Rhodobiaceae bacterium]